MKEAIPIFVEVHYGASDGFTSSAWRRPPQPHSDHIPSDFLDGIWTTSRVPPTSEMVSAALNSIVKKIIARV